MLRGRLSICALVAACLFGAGCGGNASTSTESAASKQRVVITAKIGLDGTAVVEMVRDGALKRDSGTFELFDKRSLTPDRTVMRNGQKVDIHTAVWTFTGQRGSLSIRERTEWVDVGNDADGDGQNDGIAVGTWKVVLGTDDYAGVRGGGRSGHEGLGLRWYARYEGFLTAPQ